jgi:hypothetical protein
MKKTILRSLGAMALLTTTMAIAGNLHDGLVAYWPLDTFDTDGSGNIVDTPDVIAGHNLLVRNIASTTNLVAGRYGNAIQFNGTNQYCYFTTPSGQNIGLPINRNPSYTISFWVKGNNNQAEGRVFSIASTTSNDPMLSLDSLQNPSTTSAAARLYIRNSGTAVLVDYQTSTNPMLDNTWHHVGLVYNSGALQMYVDAKLDYTKSFTQTTNFDITSIGALVRLSGVLSYFKGAVDDVAVWSRALSPAEINNIMTNSVTDTYVPDSPPVIVSSPVGTANLMEGDSWTLSAMVTGPMPITYQWYKNGAGVAGATDMSLALTNMITADAGNYVLVAANMAGSATSAVAQLAFLSAITPNLTNGIISYWPLDTVLGTKTPDLVSGYDMSLANMSDTNLVDGRFGKCLQFYGNIVQGMLSRKNNTGDDLPIYNKTNFTISAWINAYIQSDARVYAEGCTSNSNPLFTIGTDQNGKLAGVDFFMRTDNGIPAIPGGYHTDTAGTAYDGTWHNIVYVQRDMGNGNTMGTCYIDGVRDSVSVATIRPISMNTTAIGGLLRSAPSAWFLGLIDEVSVWARALSQDEINLLQTTTITNPPSRLQPLVINSFTAELPTVAKGDSTILHWDVSKDASQVIIDKIGDVTSQTVMGVGNTNITPDAATTYTLTVKRGVDTLSASAAVTFIDKVAAGWTLLDNFDTYPAGPLFGTGYWGDLHGDAGQVVTFDGNRMLRTTNANSDIFLNLQSLSIQEQEICTLFFRMVLTNNDENASITQIVGLTDKSQQDYADEVSNIGPVLYFTPFTNDAVSITTNAWFVGARNWAGSAITYADQPLETNTVYNVWIDITNAPMADPTEPYDMFWVYIQKEGDSTRTLVFDGYTSDRNPYAAVDPVIGGMTPNLNKLVVLGNGTNANYSALFDDFYLTGC